MVGAEAAKQAGASRGTESSKDCGHDKAKTYQRAADRNATRDAKAIKRPGAAEPLAAAR